jgi:hypothetical protein
MFEDVKTYRFWMRESCEGGGAISEFSARITDVALLLISCDHLPALGGQPSTLVINTSSLAFINDARIDQYPETWLLEIANNM